MPRLQDGDLELIHARWQASPNSDGAVTWYLRDVGALLGEVIALRQLAADLVKRKDALEAEVERMKAGGSVQSEPLTVDDIHTALLRKQARSGPIGRG